MQNSRKRVPDRQRTKPASSCRKQGVANRGRLRRYRSFTQTAGCIVAVDGVSVGLWYFVDSAEAVVVEVALFHHPVLHGNSAMHGCAETVNDSAGDLVVGTLWNSACRIATVFQSTSSSSAIIIGKDVLMPWPISGLWA